MLPKPKYLLITVVLLLAPGLFWGAQLKQIAIIDLPGQPGFDGMAVLNGHVIMSHSAANTVDIFHSGRRRLVAQVKGLSQPRGLAIDAQGGRVFIANHGNNSITILNASDWKVQQNVALPFSPYRLLYVPELNRLLVSTRWQAVTAVPLDGSSNSRTAEVGGRPEGMVFDPARRAIFVTVQDRGEVVALDPEMKVLQRYPLAASQPTGLALDQSGRRLFVAARYAVVVMDADRGAEVARIPAAAGTDSLWFDEPSRTLYAGATGGTIAVIRQEGGRYVQQYEYNTEVRGHTIAFDPASRMLYMPGGRDGRSKLLILRDRSEILQNDPNAPQVASHEP